MKADSFFDVKIIAFGTHLSKKHKHTVDEIYKDGFKVAYEINTMPAKDSAEMISKSMGTTIEKFAKIWEKEHKNIDLILCLGDRYEMFAAVAASLPFNIRIAHMYGGDTTLGAIDDKFRHAITAMAQLHFTSTTKSAKRVAEMKGSSKGVHKVGVTSLDNLKEMKLLSKIEFKNKFGVLPKSPVLVTFHPETVATSKNENYCKELIKAMEKLDEQIFITLPNADTGNEWIRKQLLQFSRSSKNVHCFESLGTQGYFSAINMSSFLLGNTSSGIVEAASFAKYVINLGDRQKGREKGKNIIDCKIESASILRAIGIIKKSKSLTTSNIYGNGSSSEKIISILKERANN